MYKGIQLESELQHTQERDPPHNDRPSASFVAQQYYCDTFVQMRFHFHKKI
jgi:hypothetical protein